MKKYKHYSFDLWLTLIKSNPVFKQEKAKYFFEKFNRDKKTLQEVTEIIRDIDIMCNAINERVGKNIDTYEMYGMILHRLNYDYSSFTYRDFESIHNVLAGKFKIYSPTLYDPNTLDTLIQLKRSGATLSILSNTGFIKGSQLSEILGHIGIKYLFDFEIYSDMLDSSKPNELMFDFLKTYIKKLRIHNPVQADEIVHVGDNLNADFKGAQMAGIHAFTINSNDKTIKDLL